MDEKLKLTTLATCSGCGAKMGAGTLKNFLKNIHCQPNPNVLVGFDKSDDACVYKITEDKAVILTADFFPPIVDDPYTYGQIAAANALSDVYAMGGLPQTALNLMCISNELSDEIAGEILCGGADKVNEANATITGGHTIKGTEPIYGLSVMGLVHPQKILTNSNAKIGDCLILTKPLGTGIITTAVKAGVADSKTAKIASDIMATLNKNARNIMVKYDVHSCTDVTGFGLAGHAFEMADGSNVSIEIDVSKIPLIPQAYEFASMGLIPAGAYRNRDYVNGNIAWAAGSTKTDSHQNRDYMQENITIKPNAKAKKELALEDIIYDPQTSGGLLFSISQTDVQKCLIEMIDLGIEAAIIGTVMQKRETALVIV